MISRKFITVVSGLPRSGTSMMMRMLEAGGMPAITDGIRTADADNPGGYYEFERAKQTREDSSWLSAAEGRAVKMIYRLLYDLPAGREYRVLFMQRELTEVLRSQKKMLDRSGKPLGPADDAQMMGLFRREIEKCERWLAAQPHFAVRYVDYNALLANPQPHAEQLNSFLGGGLNVAAMAAVVDPSLYRNRSAEGELSAASNRA